MPLWLTMLLYIVLPVGIFCAFQLLVLLKCKRLLVKLLPIICAGVSLVAAVAAGCYIVVCGDFLSLAMLDVMVMAGVCALAVIGCGIGKFAAKLVEIRNSSVEK